MNEQQQAKQLEAYIHALRKNPAALPPPGLDESMVTFARKLVISQNTKHLERKARANMWQSVLDQSFQSVEKEKYNMNYTYTRALTDNSQKRSFGSITWVASILIVLLIGGVMLALISMVRAPEPESNFGAAAQMASSTPTTDDVIETPIRDDVVIVSVTPTVIPYEGAMYTQIPPGYVPVITSFVEIAAGSRIRDDMLVTVLWPDYQYPSGGFALADLIVDKYARVTIPRFMPLLDDFLVNDPAEVGELSQITIVTPTPVATTTPTFVPSSTFIVTPTPSQ